MLGGSTPGSRTTTDVQRIVAGHPRGTLETALVIYGGALTGEIRREKLSNAIGQHQYYRE